MTFLFLLLNVSIYALIPLLILLFKQQIRTYLLYIYFGCLIFFTHTFTMFFKIPLNDTLTINGGTIAYAALMYTVFIHIIMERKITTLRNLLIIFILCTTFYFILLQMILLFLSTPTIINTFDLPANAINLPLINSIGGSFVDIVELLLLHLLFEWTKNFVKKYVHFSLLYIIFFNLILLLDSVLFTTVFLLISNFSLDYGSQFLVKLTLGIFFTPFLILFFIFYSKSAHKYFQTKLKLKSLWNQPKANLIDMITDQQSSLDEFEQRNQRFEALGVLAGGIAHDFNNLLAVISMNVSFLQEDMKNKNTVDLSVLKEILDSIQQASLKGKGLGDQLLAISKNQKLNQHPHDIIRLITQAAKFVLSGDTIEYILQTDFPEWYGLVDEHQLNQVFINVLLNAKQAMLHGGKIYIRIKETDVNDLKDNFKFIGHISTESHYLEIQIQDEGHGMSDTVLSKLFNPFFTTKPGGKGLGLIISNNIVHKHGGFIGVITKENIGTTFTIFLPISLRTQPQEDEKNCSSLLNRKLRILVLEDNQELNEILTKQLQSMQYDVFSATSGEIVLQFFKELEKTQGFFDIALIDLFIENGIDGVQTMQKVHTFDPHLPAIAMTGYFNSDLIIDPQKFGFAAVIEKPFTITTILNSIDQCLKK